MARSRGAAEAPLIQERPAEPAGLSRRAVREQPTPRLFEVTGPHEVGGVATGGQVELWLTDAQAGALIEAGHVTPAAPPKEPDRPSVAAKKGSD